LNLSDTALALIIASPVVGSFLGVVIERLPAGRNFVWSRSECDYCKHELGPLDLIPFASWLLSRGHCRYCGARISTFYPLIELGAVSVAIWSAVAALGWTLPVSCALGWALLVIAILGYRKNNSIWRPIAALAVWLAWIYGIAPRL
jgi:leader peptidase (prepilin peptidase)/N-methyltransferase